MVFDADELRDVEDEKKNRAKDIVEDFMIAANGVTARYLSSKNLPSLRAWSGDQAVARIVELAAETRYSLPAEPDSNALEQFLERAKAADPLRFPELSFLSSS